MKLHPLTDLNVPIDYENFDPKRSKVSMSLGEPSPSRWKPTAPTRRMWNSDKEMFVRVTFRSIFSHIMASLKYPNVQFSN